MRAERAEWSDRTRDIDPEDLIFLDQSHADTKMARRYGRTPRGKRAVGHVPAGTWESVTMLSAIEHDGTTTNLVPLF